MKGKLLLIGLLVLAIAISGCVQQPQSEPQTDTEYKYVCSDSTIKDKAIDCPIQEEVDLEKACEVYCNEPGTNEPGTKEYIKAEMNAANYCEIKENCALTNTKCPLGCYNLVNSAELERINTLVKNFKQTCFQTCTKLQDMKCEEGKCVPVTFGTG